MAPSPLDEGLTFIGGRLVPTASRLFWAGDQMFALGTRVDPALPPLMAEDGTIEPGRTDRYLNSAFCGFDWLGLLNGRR